MGLGVTVVLMMVLGAAYHVLVVALVAQSFVLLRLNIRNQGLKPAQAILVKLAAEHLRGDEVVHRVVQKIDVGHSLVYAEVLSNFLYVPLW